MTLARHFWLLGDVRDYGETLKKLDDCSSRWSFLCCVACDYEPAFLRPFLKMACLLLGEESPVLPVDLVKKGKFYACGDLVTERFSVPRVFVSKELWDLRNRKENSMIQTRFSMDKTCFIHISYGWSPTEQKNRHGVTEGFVMCYAKVASEKLDALLFHSGRSGVLIDRFAKEKGQTSVCHSGDWLVMFLILWPT